MCLYIQTESALSPHHIFIGNFEAKSKDGGTLVQLRNLTRRSLPQNPKNDVNTSDDFILKGHILAATIYDCTWYRGH